MKPTTQEQKLPDFFHINDTSTFVRYADSFEDFPIIAQEENPRIELVDWYCTDSSCNCSETKLEVLEDGEKVGELFFNYAGDIVQDSPYAPLLEEPRKEFLFIETLMIRHALLNDHPTRQKVIGMFDRARKLGKGKKRKNNMPNYRKKPMVREKKVGRNEPCSCGSGKKYKKCCMKK